MGTASRRHPARLWLLGLVVVDLVGLTALLLNQWLAGRILVSWLLAVLLGAVTLPWLSRLVDSLLEAAGNAGNVPMVGEKNP